ncbi:hypothetical protein QFC21_000390 [Naganishia friedmannii]|uniref:Uncharacterized protein n=1 Tax=Naganishia friedmannii TaxID=89922 RepID=A0ACC2WC61_9TREE|nr:hypothetical protein QFC21_000390 [Naganishia friedmannii]
MLLTAHDVRLTEIPGMPQEASLTKYHENHILGLAFEDATLDNNLDPDFAGDQRTFVEVSVELRPVLVEAID